MIKQHVYKGHYIRRADKPENAVAANYWHVQPAGNAPGVTGKVYGSVKEAKRLIDAGLKKPLIAAAPVKQARQRERVRK